MSEKKKLSSSSSSAAGGGQKKKPRPPPLVVSDAPPPVPGPPGGNFALPTMRHTGMFVPNQQIMVTPSAQIWDIQEQTQLERLQRVMCFPNESLLNRSIKIAAHLSAKTVRDVACRLKAMEENVIPSAKPTDEIDRFLMRGETIISELQTNPVHNRTEDQVARLNNLMREFITGTRECRSKLDGRQLKIPVQYVPVPELPEFLKGTEKSSSGAAAAASGK